MRKNNDGYVIIYVVFVLVFLCAVAVSVCSVSLSNLQTQTAQTQKLQSKYAAMGEIEKFMAEVCTESNGTDNRLYETSGEAKNAALRDIETIINSKQVYNEDDSDNLEWGEPNSTTCTVEVKAGNVNATIKFEFVINSIPKKVDEKNLGTEEEPDWHIEYNYCYNITSATSKYTSFQIGGAA